MASSSNRSASRSAICSGDSVRTLAAASSIASGTPSSVRQMSATAAWFAAVSAKPGRAAAARSTNSCTASDWPVPGPAGRGPAARRQAPVRRRQAPVRRRQAPVRRRQAQRGNPPDDLAADSERLPAGRDHPQPRAGGQQPVHQLGAALHHVLAGVQDQQHGLRAERLGERVGQRPVGLGPDAEGRADHRHQPFTGLGSAWRGARAARPGDSGDLGVGQVGDPDPVGEIGCRAWRPSRSASRVLPIPPGPHSVSARTRPRMATSSVRSRSRPMKLLGSAGRLPGTAAMSEVMGHQGARRYLSFLTISGPGRHRLTLTQMGSL